MKEHLKILIDPSFKPIESYVWRNTWISKYESPWNVFQKFRYANNSNLQDIFNIFGTEITKLKHYSASSKSLITLEGLNPKSIRKIIGVNLKLLNHKYIDAITAILPDNGTFYINPTLTFCPICMKKGYHSIFHQFILFTMCPFHNVPLQDTCPNCGYPINYMLNNNPPFSCSCGHVLIRNDLTFMDYLNLWEKSRKKIINNEIKKWIVLNSDCKERFENKLYLSPKFVHTDCKTAFNRILRSTTKDNCYSSSSETYGYTYTSDYFNNLVTFKDNDKTDYHTKFSMLKNEIYKTSLGIFKSIARHIRRRYLRKHKNCSADAPCVRIVDVGIKEKYPRVTQGGKRHEILQRVKKFYYCKDVTAKQSVSQ